MESLHVRNGVLEPPARFEDLGVMWTVWKDGGQGYAATSDLSETGLRAAADRALWWAERTAQVSVADFSGDAPSSATGRYASPIGRPWESLSSRDRIDILQKACEGLSGDERIVDRQAALSRIETNSLFLTSTGGRLEQRLDHIVPHLKVTASEGGDIQSRSLGGHSCAAQAGIEYLDAIGFERAPGRLARDVLDLLRAEPCPTGTMDLLLAPDQMILQIHESIGHPLELDRILGDERNYAGTSFVTQDMFGSYRYGSELLDVTFDPTVTGELASYGFDDAGTPAAREYLIKDGILLRPLGGATSQMRANMAGVANERACSWNRAPIDRMANLNLEPRSGSLADLIQGIERGIYMQTNNSWSIDDSRNKFHFGCEYAQLIEDGELTRVVKKPNYHGISATFWRNLKRVGGPETREVMGTPNCGKGEPNQVIRVGHASPACVFGDIDVFAGA